MGAFNSAIITQKGQALFAKVVAGTATFNFTHIKTSETVLSGDIARRTDIGIVKQTSKVASVVVQNENTVKVSAGFYNDALKAGYYVRNIGLYAMDPDEGEILYSISVADESNATADWMPPPNGVGVSSLLVDLVTAVSNASKVEVEVDPTAFATISQLKSLREEMIDAFTLIKEEQNTSVAILDSANEPFVNIRLFGKSEQDGTPTSNSPKAITNVGDEGSVDILVSGKNLLNVFLANDGNTGVVTMEGDWAVYNLDNQSSNQARQPVLKIFPTNRLKPSTMYTIIVEVKSWSGTGNFYPISNASGYMAYSQFLKNFTAITGNGTYIAHHITRDDFSDCGSMIDPSVFVDAGEALSLKARFSVIEYDPNITPSTFVYSPFAEQSLSLSIPNKLRGVKVSTDAYANYTDAEGNKWLCDEVDLDKGVYIKRVGTITIDDTPTMLSHDLGEGIYRHSITNSYGFDKRATVSDISDRYVYLADFSARTPHFYIDTGIWIFNTMTNEEFKADLKNNPITIVSALENYEEIPLTKEEISAYRALYSNNSATYVTNNRDAHMAVEYYNKTAENILKPVMSRFKSLKEEIADLRSTLTEV